jgi:predicted molibdopterin-dependent oxidoreductase YjgC
VDAPETSSALPLLKSQDATWFDHGQARLVARVGEQTAPGQVFCSFHFPASGVNHLTSDQADTVTSCPEYKVTAVRVGRIMTASDGAVQGATGMG